MDISASTFYILHEEIVKKSNQLLKKLGGLDDTTDQTFYGHGEGEYDDRSINHVIINQLNEKNFDYKGFYRNDKGEPKFNIDYLRKQKSVYNHKASGPNFDVVQIAVKSHYLNAFLFFLDVKNIKEFEKKHQHYKIEKVIDHTGNSRNTSFEVKNVDFFFEDRNIPEGYLDAIKQKLENTEWYLYTYNLEYNSIVKAIVKIGEIGDGRNYVDLINAGGAYRYTGAFNFRLAPHRIISLDLVSKLIPSKHFHMKFYVNFGRTDKVIMLGKQLGFGHSYKLITCNAILVRVDQEEQSPLGIGFYEKDHEDLHPAVKLFLDPVNIQYTVIPWLTFFHFDDLHKWLIDPSQSKHSHFDSNR